MGKPAASPQTLQPDTALKYFRSLTKQNTASLLFLFNCIKSYFDIQNIELSLKWLKVYVNGHKLNLFAPNEWYAIDAANYVSSTHLNKLSPKLTEQKGQIIVPKQYLNFPLRRHLFTPG